MPFYVATITALSVRMPDLDFDSLTTAMVEASFEDAENEINKWLSRRYDLSPYQTTTASIPPMMRSLAIRLAEAYTWQRNSRGSKESLTRGNSIEKQVLANLLDLREYKASLVDTAGALIPDDKNNGAFRVLSNTKDYRDTFNEGPSSGWKLDATKRQDIEDGEI